MPLAILRRVVQVKLAHILPVVLSHAYDSQPRRTVVRLLALLRMICVPHEGDVALRRRCVDCQVADDSIRRIARDVGKLRL